MQAEGHEREEVFNIDLITCTSSFTFSSRLGKSNNTPFSSDDDSPRCNKRGVPIGSFNRRHLVPLKVNADYIKSVKHHNSCVSVYSYKKRYSYLL